MKRSKNIFNKNILPQSLLEEDNTKQFKIGDITISSDWLKNIKDDDIYYRNILSSMHLSEKLKDLHEIRQYDDITNSPTKQGNMFKSAKIKKQINKFELIQIQKKQYNQQELENRPPNSNRMSIQKLVGFFNSPLERKFRIQNKSIFIESQKDQNKKEVFLNVHPYTLQLESKQKTLNKKEFENFTWTSQQKTRMLMYGENLRSYCIYGEIDELKKFQRYFQAEKIEVIKIKAFEKLNDKFYQRMVTHFGNKVRFYDHNLRTERTHKQTLSIVKNMMEPTLLIEQPKRQKSDINSSLIKKSGLKNDRISEKLNESNISQIFPQNIKQGDSNSLSSHNNSNYHGVERRSSTFFIKQQSKEKQSSSTIKKEKPFKLKLKSNTIYYDQLFQQFTFDNPAESYTIGDIKLGLRDDIGMSDVDEVFSEQQFPQFRLNKKKVFKYNVNQNSEMSNQHYNIQIHEISNYEGESSIRQSEKSTPRESSLTDPFYMSRIQKIPSEGYSLGDDMHRDLLKKNFSQTSNISDFLLERPNNPLETPIFSTNELHLQDQRRPLSEIYQDSQKKIEKEKFLIKNFTKKKICQIDVVETEIKRKYVNYFGIEGLQFFLPYNSKQINFEMYQLDPELETQNKIVSCNSIVGKLIQNPNNENQQLRYRSYIPSECLNNSTKMLQFQLSDQSCEMVFVFKETAKYHYIPFTLNVTAKYQVDCSKFLLTNLDKEGFKFACKLSMYTSPTSIKQVPKLSTLQFLQKYLSEPEFQNDYNFKQDFINRVKSNQKIQNQWNMVHIQQIIKAQDDQQFHKAVYKGFPSHVYQSLLLKVKKNFNPKILFSFNDKQLRLIEDAIINLAIFDIKVFMKTGNLILKVVEGFYNECFRERLLLVYVYVLHRYGNVRNLAQVLIKEVLVKVESLILMCRKEEEVYAVMDLYFEVEYQIDALFKEIWKYFIK